MPWKNWSYAAWVFKIKSNSSADLPISSVQEGHSSSDGMARAQQNQSYREQGSGGYLVAFEMLLFSAKTG